MIDGTISNSYVDEIWTVDIIYCNVDGIWWNNTGYQLVMAMDNGIVSKNAFISLIFFG